MSNNNPLNLKEMVAIQEGAVVSKEILRSEKGTITIFAFGKGQGLSEHTNPYEAALQVIEGETEVTIGGKAQPVKEGELILLPANIPHAVMATTDMKMVLTMIRA